MSSLDNAPGRPAADIVIDIEATGPSASGFDVELVRQAIQATLDVAGADLSPAWAPGLTLVVIDDDAVQQLNRKFRGVDKPTDVLSFPATADDPDFITAPEADGDGDGYLGDIVISAPRAAAQAIEYGHSLDREMSFLAVHGVLHLLGHDHEQIDARRRMRELEERIMARFPALKRNG